ncbi:unnamed protein product [Diamesa serratosioi]
MIGYLEDQTLEDVYTAFCESSLYLNHEFEALQYGNKAIDTSMGLINIISDYYVIKSLISEFISSCPKTPIIVEMIQTNGLQQRLKLIINLLKENLNKIELIPERKRKHEDDFESSVMTTSTPELQNAPKRPKISLTTPFMTLSKTTEKKAEDNAFNRKELPFTSSDTSDKEDYVEDDEICEKTTIKPRNFKTMREAVLEKPDFVSKMVELINKTLNAKELEGTDGLKASTSKTTNDGENECLTSEDLENIMSLTQNDPNYDEIVQEVIDKYLCEEFPTTAKTSTPTPALNLSKTETLELDKTPIIIEVPIKERLRSRSVKKVNVKVKKDKKKINIISNEIYTGKIPEHVGNMNYSLNLNDNLQCQQLVQEPQLLLNMPIYLQNGLEMLPFITSGPFGETSAIISTLPFSIDQNMIIPLTTVHHDILTQQLTEEPVIEEPLIEDPVIEEPVREEPFNEEPFLEEAKSEVEVEKKEDTPKRTMSANYLQSKSKSTPRRKLTHVRTLDFTYNITPTRFTSKKRMSTIEEFTTPHSGIRLFTPGSAPATINASKIKKKVVPKAVTAPEALLDDNSMLNSISNTPKVVKNPRSCARKLSNSSEDSEQKMMMKKLELKRETVKEKKIEQKPFSLEDWNQLRSVANSNSWDQHIRSLNSNQVDTERKTNRSRKTPRKNLKQKKGKTLSPEGEPEKENDAQNVEVVATAAVENEVLDESKSTNESTTETKDLMKFRIASPRKAALKSPSKKPKIATKKVKQIAEVVERKKVSQPKKKKRLVKVPIKKVAKLKIPDVVAQLIGSCLEQQTNEPEPSETKQEVAATLTELTTTILSETTTTPNDIPNPMVRTFSQSFNMACLLETPFKSELLTIPNTPRFAIPLTSTQETPFPKAMITSTINGAALSLIKNCDIQTPSFPITPGFSGTPLRSGNEGSPTVEGYPSRRTDYSSCSSYYKPDDTEEPIVKQDSMTKYRQNNDRNSESDVSTYAQHKGSAKKVDCPGVIERVKSFNEDQNTIPMPHYTMLNEDCLLNESFMAKVTSGSSNSNNSSSSSSSSSDSDSSCSSCSSSSSSDDDQEDEKTVKKRNSSIMRKLDQAASTDDKDSDWRCDAIDTETSNALVDTKGEVRFPLRSWITPKKIDLPEVPQPKISSAQTLERRKSLYAVKLTQEHSEAMSVLEEKKKRTLEKLRNEVPTTSSRALGKVEKLKRANVKAYKIPASNEFAVVTNKDKILQRTCTERSRPTPLKLIPSSSKRKNATPRKIVYLDKIPTLSPTKRANFKRSISNAKKIASASKKSVPVVEVAEQIKPKTMDVNIPLTEDDVNESVDETPNASINSFSSDIVVDGEEVEKLETLLIVEQPQISEDKGDFFIEQEVEESVVEDENVVESKSAQESDHESEIEGELEFALSSSLESSIFIATETSTKPTESKNVEESTCAPIVYEINDVKHTISDSETQVLFSMDPEPAVSLLKVNANVVKKTKDEDIKKLSSRRHKKSTDQKKIKSTDDKNSVASKSSKTLNAEDKKSNDKSKKQEEDKKNQHKEKEVKCNEDEARKSSEKETVAKSVDDSDITAILAKIHG